MFTEGMKFSEDLIPTEHYDLRFSDVDGMYRRWQDFTYLALGIDTEEDVAARKGYSPRLSVCTGVFADRQHAVLDYVDRVGQKAK